MSIVVRRLILGCAALMLVAGVASNASAYSCIKLFGSCSSTTSITEWTDEPTVICPNGVPVVRIASDATCSNGSSASTVTLKCGIFSDVITFSGGGVTHALKPAGTWEDVLDGNCRSFKYGNDSQVGRP